MLGPITLIAFLTLNSAADGGASLHEGFETPRVAWRQEETDATVNLLAHDRSGRAAHDGQRSEHLRFSAQAGSYLYYSYRLPRVPIAPDLRATLFVRSDPAGLQLLGRVVLPADVDPDTGQPSFVTVLGTASDTADRWQKLELADLPAAVERQARVLRAGSNRKVSLEGAYLERLVVNLYGGPGEAEVFLDDLTVSPVPEAAVAEARSPEAPRIDPTQPGPGNDPKSEGVRLSGNRLRRDGQDWVPLIVRAPGADLEALRRDGLDVLAVDRGMDPEIARRAAGLGFLLMPALDGDPAAFPAREAVAFWSLGEDLGALPNPAARKDQLKQVRAAMTSLRRGPEVTPKLATATVSEGFRQYAQPGQGLDLTGVDPNAWGTVQPPWETFMYMLQRRDLAALSNLQGFYWAWVPAAAPPAFRRAIWGTDPPPAWGNPRVQPEQLRLYSYAALAAGYRGLGFKADAELTRDSGLARRHEIALLAMEMRLIEPIIALGADPFTILPTFPPDKQVKVEFNTMNRGGLLSRGTSKPEKETPPHPSIRAVSVSTKDGKGRLLLLADYADGAQWQPPQMAINDLKIVAQVPESATAWEVSLGEVRNLDCRRTVGGRRISLPDFGATALVLVTTDLALVDRLRAEVERLRPVAIPRAIDQAVLQYEWVAEVHRMLTSQGHGLRDTRRSIADPDGLLALAAENIASAREALAREDYPLAWLEARRAGRPLRVLMRLHFDQALEDMTKATRAALGLPEEAPTGARRDRSRPELIHTPVASPALVSFNTLPQHYYWVDQIRASADRFGANLVPSGGFEGRDVLKTAGWVSSEGYAYDKHLTAVTTVKADGLAEGGQALKLVVSAKASELDRLPPFVDHPAAAATSPPVPVDAMQLLRIRVKVKMPRPTPPGSGGLIVRDSIGGEALQFRSTSFINDWREVVLYRRAPGPGSLTVTLALAGFGEAFFDDLRIERIESSGPVARGPERPAR